MSSKFWWKSCTSNFNSICETVYEMHGKFNSWFYINQGFYGSTRTRTGNDRQLLVKFPISNFKKNCPTVWGSAKRSQRGGKTWPAHKAFCLLLCIEYLQIVSVGVKSRSHLGLLLRNHCVIVLSVSWNTPHCVRYQTLSGDEPLTRCIN
jgi:hypothetical protein